MPESIDVKLKRAAIVLAGESSYPQAAEKLNISSAELEKQIAALEAQLCLRIFEPTRETVELTEEGQFLINAFSESVARHDRKVNEGASGTP